jgi:hypothetical protein
VVQVTGIQVCCAPTLFGWSALSGEVVEIHSAELDRDSVVALDSGEPLACMFELECLMRWVESPA